MKPTIEIFHHWSIGLKISGRHLHFPYRWQCLNARTYAILSLLCYWITFHVRILKFQHKILLFTAFIDISIQLWTHNLHFYVFSIQIWKPKLKSKARIGEVYFSMLFLLLVVIVRMDDSDHSHCCFYTDNISIAMSLLAEFHNLLPFQCITILQTHNKRTLISRKVSFAFRTKKDIKIHNLASILIKTNGVSREGNNWAVTMSLGSQHGKSFLNFTLLQ